VGEFFPEDLPVDWQLSYFANEFTEVLVPQASWIAAGSDLLQTWIDDVGEDFHFFLEIAKPVELALCEEKARLLRNHFGGFVLTEHIARKNGWKKYSIINQQLVRKVFCTTDASMLAAMPVITRLEGVGVALAFNGKNLGDLPTQRSYFEGLVDAISPETEVLLTVSGTPLSIDKIKNLQQLAQLMGLA
jgi:hypothetical protein